MTACHPSRCHRVRFWIRLPSCAAVGATVLAAVALAGCGQGKGASAGADDTPIPTSAAAAPATGHAATSVVTSPQSSTDTATVVRIDQDDTGDASVLPASIVRALETDQRVLDCAAGTRDGVSQFAANWVGVRRIDLDDDGRLDWLLNGRHACLRPEGTAAWWAYAEDADGQRMVMAGKPAASVEVMPSMTQGFHDLGMTRRDGSVARLRYAGEGYAGGDEAGAAGDDVDVDATGLGDRIDTVAGPLQAVAASDGPLADRYTLILAGQTVMTTGQGKDARFNDFPKPTLLRRFTRDVAPFDEVIVVQQDMWGNACDGGPLWMLGLKRDGTHAVSKPIDFCGGAAPRITEVDGGLRIVLPGSAVNPGQRRVAEQIWRYHGGVASRQ